MNDYNNGTLKYSILKDTVADILVEMTRNFIKNKNDIIQDKSYIEKNIKELSEKARENASKNISDIKNLVGLL
jgi:tryptophanyl-tRNA synthetase